MCVAVTEELHVYRHGVWLQQDALKYNMLIGCLIFIRWWSISWWFLYSIICNWIILRFTYSIGYSCCSHEVFINEECIWICFQQNDWNFLVGKEKYSNIAAHWKGGKRWKTKAFFLLILMLMYMAVLQKKKKLPSAKKKKSYAKLHCAASWGEKKKPFVYINLEVCSEVRNSSYFQDPEILGYCFC